MATLVETFDGGATGTSITPANSIFTATSATDLSMARPMFDAGRGACDGTVDLETRPGYGTAYLSWSGESVTGAAFSARWVTESDMTRPVFNATTTGGLGAAVNAIRTAAGAESLYFYALDSNGDFHDLDVPADLTGAGVTVTLTHVDDRLTLTCATSTLDVAFTDQDLTALAWYPEHYLASEFSLEMRSYYDNIAITHGADEPSYAAPLRLTEHPVRRYPRDNASGHRLYPPPRTGRVFGGHQ